MCVPGHRFESQLWQARGSVSHRQLGVGQAELAPLSNSFHLNILSIFLWLDLASNSSSFFFLFFAHFRFHVRLFWPFRFSLFLLQFRLTFLCFVTSANGFSLVRLASYGSSPRGCWCSCPPIVGYSPPVVSSLLGSPVDGSCPLIVSSLALWLSTLPPILLFSALCLLCSRPIGSWPFNSWFLLFGCWLYFPPIVGYSS